MAVAQDMAHRSACTVSQVGAVVVSPSNRIIATGYNGPPAGLASERFLGRPASCADDCPRAQVNAERTPSYAGQCISVHAEPNSLMFCDRRDREGGTIYVTAVTCLDCAKLVANSGLARIVMIDDGQLHRPFPPTRQFLVRAGLEVVRWEVPTWPAA